jgi:hypothetical protein
MESMGAYVKEIGRMMEWLTKSGALHSLFLYSDLPLPCRPPSYWLRLFLSQTFSRINTPTFSNLVILHAYPPMTMEQTECSETPEHKIQMPGNYPEESIQQELYNFL